MTVNNSSFKSNFLQSVDKEGFFGSCSKNEAFYSIIIMQYEFFIPSSNIYGKMIIGS